MHNIKLKKYYFINKFNKNNINNLDINTAIIYRNYKKPNQLNDIIKARNFCKKRRIKFYLSNNIKLSLKLDLDGAYIPSFNKDFNHLSFSYKKSFKIIGSAHNLKQIRNKEVQKVEKIFLSSLFKKNKNYLGINKFKLLSKVTMKKVVVLGGISEKNIHKLNLLDNLEFAGISYFE